MKLQHTKEVCGTPPAKRSACCEKAGEWELYLYEYAEGMADDAVKAAVEEHVTTCDSCRRTLTEITEMLFLLREAPAAQQEQTLEPPAHIRQRVMQTVYAEAAQRTAKSQHTPAACMQDAVQPPKKLEPGIYASVIGDRVFAKRGDLEGVQTETDAPFILQARAQQRANRRSALIQTVSGLAAILALVIGISYTLPMLSHIYGSEGSDSGNSALHRLDAAAEGENAEPKENEGFVGGVFVGGTKSAAEEEAAAVSETENILGAISNAFSEKQQEMPQVDESIIADTTIMDAPNIRESRGDSVNADVPLYAESDLGESVEARPSETDAGDKNIQKEGNGAVNSVITETGLGYADADSDSESAVTADVCVYVYVAEGDWDAMCQIVTDPAMFARYADVDIAQIEQLLVAADDDIITVSPAYASPWIDAVIENGNLDGYSMEVSVDAVSQDAFAETVTDSVVIVKKP
ncbi:MAG: zf-HC2 domain-containing protein [Clostridia bacterium]|nr:zf-HC2 domain-containing protein [Clostridia bacterium]